MNDLIDRQAAFNALDSAAEKWNIAEPYHEGIRAGLRQASRIIMNLPSAEKETRMNVSISREETYKILCEEYPLLQKEHLKRVIDKVPSAEPEVIRCKDCGHSVEYYHDGDCYCSNPKWGLMYFGGSWEFYCADAERRTRR